MRRVVVESPYAGAIDANVAYARRCLQDCLQRGEAPLAAHLLYPQVLDDADREQRDLGMAAGLAWVEVADAVVVYIDRGISLGMRLGIEHATQHDRPVEYRTLGSG